ncbi:TonB-dependent receptor [Fibrella aquatilis]|uniref:TonB-dependent receptor n=1 Tax=Fibrella aquatilis TaxID=2817059 RepID=A0A939JVA1_9BACT|nr:TonB-dependent receptor [Fibrella aquatilis]MBO0930637.1 TonB-dependent receptor [Fibrella aquatilis]
MLFQYKPGRWGAVALLWLLSVAVGFAQGVQGRVTDTKNSSSLPGVTVFVVGTNTGASTDADGNYAIRLSPGNYTLRFSFVGYDSVERPVTVAESGTATVDMALGEGLASLSEVVVIGSRAATARSNIQTPVPVDVIGAKEMRSYAQTDVTQILNFIAPSFSSNRQAVSDGTDHIDPASLRGLGPDQVLVLVNGKRRHNTALVNINGTFGRGTVGTDMNAIPVAAIERVEVLRDGAAAQYGSDAIAGVINIVLKKNTPWSVSAQYGQSASHSDALNKSFTDGKTVQVDLSKGFQIGQKGFINVGAQYLDRGATNRGGIDTRPLLYTSLPSRSSGETPDAFVARYEGLVNATTKAADDQKAQAGGLDRNNMRVGNAELRNIGFMANGQFGVGNGSTEVYFQTGLTNKLGTGAAFYRLPSQATQVDLTLYPNGFLPLINTSVYDLSGSVGARGQLASGWRWDLSNTYGGNSIRFDISNTLNASLPLGTSPSSFYAGTLQFRQNTSNLDFSRRYALGGGTTRSINTAFGVEHRIDNFEITPGEERSYSRGFPDGQNFRGNNAAGAQGFPGYKPSNALNKSRNNTGIYADIEAELGPRVLLEAAGRYENYSDFGSNFSYKATGRLSIIDDLALRGAVATGFRAPSLHQRYFNSESTQFVNSVPRQVLTVNNDSPIVGLFGVGNLRAELSKSYSLGLAGKRGSFSFTVDAYQIDITNRIVFSSQFNRESGNLTTGTVNQILNTVDPVQITTQPSGTTAQVANINTVQFFTNAINTTTRGIDLVLNERIRIGANTLTLTAAANFNKTLVTNIAVPTEISSNTAVTNSLFDRQERSRFESSVPRSKINLSGSYGFGRWNVFARSVRFGEVTYLSPTSPYLPNGTRTQVAGQDFPVENDQTFSAKWITDLTVSYNVTKAAQLQVGANNLFDVYPDVLYVNPRNNANNLTGNPATSYSGGLDNTSNGRFVYSRAVQQFGFNGRFLFARASYTF